jgi:hypothetical protein
VLAVERKGCVAEFSANVLQPRFVRELERLEAFRYPFVLLEFGIEDVVAFPEGSDIPRYRWRSLRSRPRLILAKLNEFQLRFRTKFVPVGSKGREYASSLFKRVVEAEKRPCPSPSTKP